MTTTKINKKAINNFQKTFKIYRNAILRFDKTSPKASNITQKINFIESRNSVEIEYEGTKK